MEVPELETSVFIVPGDVVKNGRDRRVVLNRVAASVVDGQRGRHPEYVFPYRKRRIARIHNTAWRHARLKAARQYAKMFGRACPEGFRNIRVRVLKHTFGRRLRTAGVSFEDRQDLAGPPFESHHHAQLGGGTAEPGESSQSGLRGKLPKKS